MRSHGFRVIRPAKSAAFASECDESRRQMGLSSYNTLPPPMGSVHRFCESVHSGIPATGQESVRCFPMTFRQRTKKSLLFEAAASQHGGEKVGSLPHEVQASIRSPAWP